MLRCAAAQPPQNCMSPASPPSCLMRWCSARFSPESHPLGEAVPSHKRESHSKVMMCSPCTPPCINSHEQAAPHPQGPMPCQEVLLHKVARVALHVSAA